MQMILPYVSSDVLLLAIAITSLAGLVKGVTGFAMPMVMISGLSLIVPPDAALAALILPTVVTNVWQALRQGWPAAKETIQRFKWFLLAGLVTLLTSAQMVRILSSETLYLLIGAPVAVFAILRLAGFAPKLTPSRLVETTVGAFAGFVGGVSGVWGPPTVAYLTAIETPKSDQMRAQGVIYSLGAVALLAAHVQSGVMRAETAPLSVILILPALAGMVLGWLIQDRFNQDRFRRVTLWVLLIAGLNLVRRAAF